MTVFKKIATSFFALLFFFALALILLMVGAVDKNSISDFEFYRTLGAGIVLVIVSAVGCFVCEEEK